MVLKKKKRNKTENINGPLTIIETESVFNILPVKKTKDPNGFKVSSTKHSKHKEFQSLKKKTSFKEQKTRNTQ